jgi:hypothetical protein
MVMDVHQILKVRIEFYYQLKHNFLEFQIFEKFEKSL